MSQFVTTTQLHAMRPLGSAAERSLPRLEAILEREFKGRLTIVLAEPVERKDGAGIDWYTDIDEPVTRLAELPEPLAEYYRARLQADKTVVVTAIQQYDGRPDQAARTMSAALRNAISYPSEGNLWVAGDAASGQGRILITAWGYEPHASELAGSHDIGKREKIFPSSGGVEIDTTAAQETAAAASAASAVQTEPDARRNWRKALFFGLWALAFLLPFIIGWLLLPACGMRLPFSDRIIYGWGDGGYCRQVADPDVERGQAETEGLMAEMRRLEDALRALIALCVPAAPPAPPAPAPQTPPVDQNRLEREGRTLNPEEDSITLTWNNTNDLDLFLVCLGARPEDRIGRGSSGCGAQSSLDLNTRDNMRREPVEYIKWPRSSLLPGRYRIEVMYFTHRAPSPVKTPFTVTLRRNGVAQEFRMETPERLPGSDKESVIVTEFSVP